MASRRHQGVMTTSRWCPCQASCLLGRREEGSPATESKISEQGILTTVLGGENCLSLPQMAELPTRGD